MGVAARTQHRGGALEGKGAVRGLKAGELGDGGYTPAELRVGGYKAKDLKAAAGVVKAFNDGLRAGEEELEKRER